MKERIGAFILALALISIPGASAESHSAFLHYPGWTMADFSSLCWRWDPNSRSRYLHRVLDSDLIGRTRGELYNLLGEPDRVRGRSESYDLAIRYPNTPMPVLNLKYSAGVVAGWQLEIDVPDSGCGYCAHCTGWGESHGPVCWYLPGGKPNFPVLCLFDRSPDAGCLPRLAPPEDEVESTSPSARPRGTEVGSVTGKALPKMESTEAADQAKKTAEATPVQDNDDTPELKLAWEHWHRQVAGALYQRYAALANAAFWRGLGPLIVSARYVVTKDRQIRDVALLQKSSNPIFNTLVIGAIKSIADQQILEFPTGSTRSSMEKSATFSFGIGHGDFPRTYGNFDEPRLPDQWKRQLEDIAR